jgi:linoleate 10R-lipoxygenase
MRKTDHSFFERGKGNVCSVEVCARSFAQVSYLFFHKFNSLYRWHATISRDDEQGTRKLFEKLFPGKPLEEVTGEDFTTAAKKVRETLPDVTEWTFGEYVFVFYCQSVHHSDPCSL